MIGGASAGVFVGEWENEGWRFTLRLSFDVVQPPRSKLLRRCELAARTVWTLCAVPDNYVDAFADKIGASGLLSNLSFPLRSLIYATQNLRYPRNQFVLTTRTDRYRAREGGAGTGWL